MLLYFYFILLFYLDRYKVFFIVLLVLVLSFRLFQIEAFAMTPEDSIEPRWDPRFRVGYSDLNKPNPDVARIIDDDWYGNRRLVRHRDRTLSHDLPRGRFRSDKFPKPDLMLDSRSIYELAGGSINNSKILNNPYFELDTGLRCEGSSPSTTPFPLEQYENTRVKTRLVLEHMNASNRLEQVREAHYLHFNKRGVKNFLTLFKSETSDYKYRSRMLEYDLVDAEMRVNKAKYYLDKFNSRVK